MIFNGSSGDFFCWMEDNRILSTETKVILLCGKSDAMPPDEFRTELCDTLTTFYDNILKKSGAGGRPAALSCPFVTETASVPYPPMVPCPYPLTTPTPTPSSPLPTLPLPSLHRRCSLRRNLQRPLKNRRCQRPPPIRAGEVTKLAAGQAVVD